MSHKKLFLSITLSMFVISCANNNDINKSMISDEINDIDLDTTNLNFSSIAGNKVYFAFDKDELSSEAKETLTRQAEWIKTHNAKILIEGYCDERGTREYNLGLGMRRANIVKEYLIIQGVQQDNISITSYGKDKPIDVTGSQEEVWAQNRVAISVII